MSLLEAKLPRNRQWKRVGDNYAVTKKSRTLNASSFSEIPFVPMDAISQGGDFDARYLMKSFSAITSGTYFEKNDLLIAKITPSFENGKQSLAENLPAAFGYATTEVIPLHPINDKQDRRLLFFYLLHPDIRSYIAEKMEGTTGRQRVPESVLLDLPFPDIELDEQKTIADVLYLVQQGIKKELAAQTACLELKRATMRELFTRGLRGEAQKEAEIGLVPKSWSVETIGQHYDVASGGTPSRAVASYWDGGTIPWVKTTEVGYCTIHSTEEKITPEGLQNSAAKMFPVGTLLMAMYGQGVTRGKVAILGIEAACNQACAAMNPKDGDISPRYLFHFLTYRYEDIRQLAHGGQQQNLNLDIVRDLLVGFSSNHTEQHEIVEILDAIDRKIDLHKRKKTVLEELFKSLLHKLMTGEIRVTDLDLSALGPSAKITEA